MKMKEQSLTTNFIVDVRVFINCSQFKFAPLGIQNCAIQSNSSRTKYEKNPEDILLTISPQVRVRPGSSCAGASVRVTSPVREEERRGEETEGGRGAHKVLFSQT